eukprot:jgi/Botrbrau1/4787/Bobra.0325s0009.1
MVGRRQLAAMALPRLHMKDELLRAMPEVARLLGLEVPPPPASADSGENGPGQDVPSVIRSVVGSTARREMLQFGEELSEEEQLVIVPSAPHCLGPYVCAKTSAPILVSKRKHCPELVHSCKGSTLTAVVTTCFGALLALLGSGKRCKIA